MHRKDTHVIFIVFSAIFEGPRFVEIHKFCYYGNVTQRLFCMRVWQYRYGNTICNKAEAVSLLRLITRIVKLTSSYSQIFFFFFFYITHKYSFSLRVQGPKIYKKKKKKKNCLWGKRIHIIFLLTAGSVAKRLERWTCNPEAHACYDRGPSFLPCIQSPTPQPPSDLGRRLVDGKNEDACHFHTFTLALKEKHFSHLYTCFD